MLYRIQTENINKNGVVKLANKYFDGFTIFEGLGYWQGKPEPSLTIEVVTDNQQAVEGLAVDIRIANNQQAVLVEAISNKQKLL
jgi:hypothetical protein